MLDLAKVPQGPARTALTVALVGPDERRRLAVAQALAQHQEVRFKEFGSYPPRLESLPQALLTQYQVIIVDVDCDPEYAFRFVEVLSTSSSIYVMTYSEGADAKTVVRFMRAGVREFLTFPLDPAEFSGALTRAATHEPPRPIAAKSPGKTFAFLGVKGGCGVTTLAANFALALCEESGNDTLLIDFGLPLGDVQINLGLSTEFSLAPAMQNPDRLDASMLATLVTKHESGLSVLAAPTDFPEKDISPEAVDKLLEVAREAYEYVVVDVGSRVDLMRTSLFQPSTIVYLITQVGITEMRNTNRLVLRYFGHYRENLQIVLNRFKSSDVVFDEAQITKAMTRPADWKIPDDYAAARRTRSSPTPLALADSPISEVLREMARAVTGGVSAQEKKKSRFRLFG
jgi:pilus assembly protein CpaE